MSNASITVVISTWKQPTCLEQQLAVWRTCPVVHTIHVNAFKGDNSVTVVKRALLRTSGNPVVFDSKPNRLTERFSLPPGGFPTDAVMTVDVDTFFSCKVLSTAFELWKNSPNTRTAVVGFSPRNITKPHCRTTFKQHVCHMGEASNWDSSYYAPYVHNTLFVTKGAITHQDVYALFSGPKYALFRQKCDAAITGEDFLMSFVLALEFGSKLWMKPLFAPESESCDVDCELAKHSLGVRSSSRRPKLLRFLYDSLGDPFTDFVPRSPFFMSSLDANCNRQCMEGRHRRVPYLIKSNTIPISWNNFRTFCRSCPVQLRPSGQQCPEPTDGWTVELRAAHHGGRMSGQFVVNAKDILTGNQLELARLAKAHIVNESLSTKR